MPSATALPVFASTTLYDVAPSTASQERVAEEVVILLAARFVGAGMIAYVPTPLPPSRVTAYPIVSSASA